MDVAREHEERAYRQSVREHLEDGAFYAERIPRSDRCERTEDHEAHVIYASHRYHPLEVRREDSDYGAVEHRHYPDQHESPSPLLRRLREERDAYPYETVAPHLKQDARKQDYAEIQEILAEELPYINLWYFDNVMVYSKRVRGLEMNPSGNYDFLRTAELAK